MLYHIANNSVEVPLYAKVGGGVSGQWGFPDIELLHQGEEKLEE